MNDETEKPSGLYLSNSKLISILIAIVGVAIMGFCGMIYTDEKATQAQLNAHILSAAQQADLYVRKDDLAEIKQRLQRIEDKLDRKVDKP